MIFVLNMELSICDQALRSSVTSWLCQPLANSQTGFLSTVVFRHILLLTQSIIRLTMLLLSIRASDAPIEGLRILEVTLS